MKTQVKFEDFSAQNLTGTRPIKIHHPKPWKLGKYGVVDFDGDIVADCTELVAKQILEAINGGSNKA